MHKPLPIHIHTYIHIHTHTYTYIHIHTHTYTYIHIHTHTYIQAYAHKCIHDITHHSGTHVHTYTHTLIHTCMHTYNTSQYITLLESAMLAWLNTDVMGPSAAIRLSLNHISLSGGHFGSSGYCGSRDFSLAPRFLDLPVRPKAMDVDFLRFRPMALVEGRMGTTIWFVRHVPFSLASKARERGVSLRLTAAWCLVKS